MSCITNDAVIVDSIISKGYKEKIVGEAREYFDYCHEYCFKFLNLKETARRGCHHKLHFILIFSEFCEIKIHIFNSTRLTLLLLKHC